MDAYNRKEWLNYLPQKGADKREPGYIFEESGILNINKPAGLSSMDVLRVIKKNGQIRKAGHGGTLDPMATGVLPVLINKATRLSNGYLGSEKSYDGIILFGQPYDTQDVTGKPLEEKVEVDPALSLSDVQKVADSFLGEIEQIPPVFSALKKGGRPLYEYARKGENILPDARKVVVHEFNITEKVSNESFRFFVRCGKGVYVRTLAHDLGQILGYGGALQSLRRTSVGSLSIDDSIDLSAIQNPDDVHKHLIFPETEE